MSNRVSTPLKWHGGKHHLAGSINALAPTHKHYVEPFAGGLSVLLNYTGPPRSEVVNDLDRHLITFWSVLRDEKSFDLFVRMCQATPFSEELFEMTFALNDRKFQETTPTVMRALLFFVQVRMSMAGRRRSFTPLSKTRLRGGRNEQADGWINAVEGLAEVHERLRSVVIRHRPALEIIEQEDSPDTWFYLDPPYLGETRVSDQIYSHEMSRLDHEVLLATLLKVKGKVAISGYPSNLYNDMLTGWKRYAFDIANHSSSSETKERKLEMVWCNYDGAIQHT